MDIILIWLNDGERQSTVYIQLINFSRTKNSYNDDGVYALHDSIQVGKFSAQNWLSVD